MIWETPQFLFAMYHGFSNRVPGFLPRGQESTVFLLGLWKLVTENYWLEVGRWCFSCWNGENVFGNFLLILKCSQNSRSQPNLWKEHRQSFLIINQLLLNHHSLLWPPQKISTHDFDGPGDLSPSFLLKTHHSNRSKTRTAVFQPTLGISGTFVMATSSSNSFSPYKRHTTKPPGVLVGPFMERWVDVIIYWTLTEGGLLLRFWMMDVCFILGWVISINHSRRFKEVKVKPPTLGVLGDAVEILKHWYLNRHGGVHVYIVQVWICTPKIGWTLGWFCLFILYHFWDPPRKKQEKHGVAATWMVVGFLLQMIASMGGITYKMQWWRSWIRIRKFSNQVL